MPAHNSQSASLPACVPLFTSPSTPTDPSKELWPTVRYVGFLDFDESHWTAARLGGKKGSRDWGGPVGGISDLG